MQFKVIILALFILALSADGFSVSSIFNRIKPGHCPVKDVRLGKRDEIGAICDVVNCEHDYDCQGKDLCCPSDCGARLCVRPADKVKSAKMPGTCPPKSLYPGTGNNILPCSDTRFKLCRHGYLDDCPQGHKCCIYKCGGICVQR